MSTLIDAWGTSWGGPGTADAWALSWTRSSAPPAIGGAAGGIPIEQWLEVARRRRRKDEEAIIAFMTTLLLE